MKKIIIFLTVVFSPPTFSKSEIRNIERVQAPISRRDNIKNAMTGLGSLIKELNEEDLLESLVKEVILGQSALEIIKKPEYKDVFDSDFFKRFLGNITLNVWKNNTSASPQSIKKLGSFILTGLQRLEKKEDPKEALTELLQNAINQVIKPGKKQSKLDTNTVTTFLKVFEEDFQKLITRSTAMFPGLAHKFFTKLEDFKDTVKDIQSGVKNKIYQGTEAVKSGARWFASPFVTFGNAVKNGASSFYSTLTTKENPKKEQEISVLDANPYAKKNNFSDFALTEASNDESDFDDNLSDLSDLDSIDDDSIDEFKPSFKKPFQPSSKNKTIVHFQKK
ncbi:MAG: hypothetical protein BGO07_01570 [Alphaproteobacteria bacterium 40-19]|nr:MAG: hypothetical protein BGO07_01570 [Alphaproteobacteria bacterium 40-19]